MATKELTKESAAQIYLTGVILSFLKEGGLNELGQRAGEFEKFLIAKLGVDRKRFEDLLNETVADAATFLPEFIQQKLAKKRASA